MTYQWLDKIGTRLEDRCGNLAGVWVAIGLMVAAAIYVRPAVKTVVMGVQYAALSDDLSRVFSGNAVAFRILTPLISNLLGFHGHLIIITNLLIATAFLATVYYFFTAQKFSSGDALTAAVIMAFSLVTLTTIYYGGYTDSLTYLLVFLMWWFRQKRRLFYVLFLLALLNRESVWFLVPWFAYLRFTESVSGRSAVFDLLAGFSIVSALYLFFRAWVESHGDVSFGFDYYLGPLLDKPFYWFRQAYPFCGLGLFTVFKLFWCIPLLAGVSLWQSRQRQEVYSMLILVACVLAQLLVACDSSRMLTLAFPVVLIGLVHFFRTGAYDFRRWAGYLILGNFLVPQLYTSANIVEIMHSVPGNILMIVLRGKVGW